MKVGGEGVLSAERNKTQPCCDTALRRGRKMRHVHCHWDTDKCGQCHMRPKCGRRQCALMLGARI